MPPDLDALTRAAAGQRIADAREHLRRAQDHLNAARQSLAPLTPEPAVRRDLAGLHGRCDDAHYRLLCLERSLAAEARPDGAAL